MSGETEWLTGVVSLVSGGVIGAVLSWRWRSPDQPQAIHGEDEDAEVSSAVAHLRDLENNRGRLADKEYDTERRRWEKIAVEALKRQEQGPKASTAKAAVQRQGFNSSKWAAVVVAVAIASTMVVLLLRNVSNRAEGGSMTGGSMTDAQGPEVKLEELIAAVKASPKDAGALVNLGQMLMDVQKPTEALIYFERALQFSPDNADAQVGAAAALDVSGDTDKAKVVIEKMIAKNPTNPDPWFYLGVFNVKARNFAETKRVWTKYVELAPPGPRRDRVKGFLEGELKNGGPQGGPAGAQGGPMAEIAALRQSLAKDPKNIEALVEISGSLLKMQQIAEAEKFNAQLIALAPDNADAKVNAAMIKGAKGETDTAKAELEALLAKDPTVHRAWFFKGMMSMQKGDMDGVKASWGKFVEHAPDGPQKERIKGFLAGDGLKMPNQK